MSILRGDELTPGQTYRLVSTRQTDAFTPGTVFIASKLLDEESKSRALVLLDYGSVLYAGANDIFETM